MERISENHAKCGPSAVLLAIETQLLQLLADYIHEFAREQVALAAE